MLDDCIRIMLEFGTRVFCSKSRPTGCFQIIPISPIDYRLLGFKFKGQFYFDMCLSMVCSTSCQMFESLSQAVQWICVCIRQIFHISVTLSMTSFFSQRPIHSVSSIRTDSLKFAI